ncbi:hypothetical protein C3K47_11740 [Solitalea longa]|uniref:Lipoprotein n=1 Tax=Solitalea longa TaxID=2079460 RepID=A0A2S5A2B2_9SPHI|nr:hypothetical protein [Solitalea longa]POY36412.1 hypothetical protein C3K47_11740 [Solitalea longa]
MYQTFTNKLTKLFLLVLSVFALVSCEPASEYAEDASESGGFYATDINGTWKETKTGLVIRISGVTSSTSGTGVLTNAGTAFPSAAVGGTPLTVIEHQSGGYWDAYNNTYYTNGTWGQTKVVGLAMNDAKTEFRIGTAVYKKQ